MTKEAVNSPSTNFNLLQRLYWPTKPSFFKETSSAHLLVNGDRIFMILHWHIEVYAYVARLFTHFHFTLELSKISLKAWTFFFITLLNKMWPHCGSEVLSGSFKIRVWIWLITISVFNPASSGQWPTSIKPPQPGGVAYKRHTQLQAINPHYFMDSLEPVSREIFGHNRSRYYCSVSKSNRFFFNLSMDLRYIPSIPLISRSLEFNRFTCN